MAQFYLVLASLICFIVGAIVSRYETWPWRTSFLHLGLAFYALSVLIHIKPS